MYTLFIYLVVIGCYYDELEKIKFKILCEGSELIFPIFLYLFFFYFCILINFFNKNLIVLYYSLSFPFYRELFVQMQVGPVSPVDPAPLTAALQLDHAVQQDGQEFMKLLLTLLEHRFAAQPALRGIIQDLFRGQSGYETVCMTCTTRSESSSRSDNFYELDIPVRGFKSLGESLGSLLSPEILDGDNQYSCDKCGGKRDATRRLTVRALPPLLSISLQRFVYDYVKGDRTKATDKFAFPLELPAAALVGNEGTEADGIYDLEAILIHKGGSAMQGHYGKNTMKLINCVYMP